MSQIENVSQFSQWFHVTADPHGGIGAITAQKDFFDHLAQAREKYVDTFTSDVALRKPVSDLTEEALSELAQRYDPENMTQEEYTALIDDLIQSGVLAQEDKGYIGYSNMVGMPLDGRPLGGAYLTRTGASVVQSLSEADGNALAWVKSYQHRETSDDSRNGSVAWQKELFGIIEGVLTRMNGN